MSDFTTTEQREPATVTTTRLSGDGKVGTTYKNVTHFLGRDTELSYEVTQHDAPRLVRFRGENKTVIADDTIEIEAAAGGGSIVTYAAAFTFKGWVKWISPLLAPALKKLGDAAEGGLRAALGSQR